MNKEFILQTARDYDMPFEEVERIAERFPERFYEAMEDYIKQTANQNKQPTK